MAEKKIRLTELKHAAILGAAVSEFRERGFEAAKMDKIAAIAQVSKRTVYNHFESKEVLFRTIMEQMLKQGLRATDREYEPNTPLDVQLRDIAQREVDLLSSADFFNLSRVALSECLRTPEFLEEVLKGMEQSESGVTKWIRAAAEDGRLGVVDARVAAEQFIALIKAFAYWPQALGMSPPLRDEEAKGVIDSAVKMFLNHYTK